MNKKVKLALATLLGFSAACSNVKNAPKQDRERGSSVETVEPDVPSPIVVMYGVRPPVRPSAGDEASQRTEDAGPDSGAEAPRSPDAEGAPARE